MTLIYYAIAIIVAALLTIQYRQDGYFKVWTKQLGWHWYDKETK